MAADALNRLNPVPERSGEPTSGAYPGDLPGHISRRYFSTTKFGTPFAFYTDAQSKDPAFRDHGGRLSTDRNDPATVRDLVAIAKHRNWTIIAVRGQTDFRREVWLIGQAEGLEIRGYRPTERDRQQAERRAGHAPADRPLTEGAQARLKVVDRVVRARVVEPAEQARILLAARQRLAQWLERGAHFGPIDRPPRARDRG
jgi:hypothetical protein